MEIIELATGIRRKVVVNEVEYDDFKLLTKKEYHFDWKLYRGKMPVYKLCREDEPDTILGVVGIVDVEDEKRIEIKLIASSRENTRKRKKHTRIPGYLIAFVGNMALNKYYQYACVSLIPKTELIDHYTQKYYMTFAGWQMYLEGPALRKLLNEYAV